MRKREAGALTGAVQYLIDAAGMTPEELAAAYPGCTEAVAWDIVYDAEAAYYVHSRFCPPQYRGRSFLRRAWQQVAHFVRSGRP